MHRVVSAGTDGHKGNKILIRACWQGRNMYAKYVPHLFSCHLTSMVRMMVFDRSYWSMKCKRRRKFGGQSADV